MNLANAAELGEPGEHQAQRVTTRLSGFISMRSRPVFTKPAATPRNSAPRRAFCFNASCER